MCTNALLPTLPWRARPPCLRTACHVVQLRGPRVKRTPNRVSIVYVLQGRACTRTGRGSNDMWQVQCVNQCAARAEGLRSVAGGCRRSKGGLVVDIKADVLWMHLKSVFILIIFVYSCRKSW